MSIATPSQLSATSPRHFDLGWTAADLVERFGPMPLSRIVLDPPPGKGTVEDVVRLDDHEDRLCELIDGVLLEKSVGYIESRLAMRLGLLITQFVEANNLGLTAGEAGMMQISPEQVRMPDVSFVSWGQLKDSGYPDKAAPNMAPDLAVEVISSSNTKREMDRKLEEYFKAGTRLVWYVYPDTKTVDVYTTADKVATLAETETVTGGDVLPGLEIDLKALFAPPTPPPAEQAKPTT